MSAHLQQTDEEYDYVKNLMNEVSEVLILDLKHHAAMLPPDLRDKLRPPEEGIYFNGATQPLLLMRDGPYGTLKDFLTHRRITKQLTLVEIMASEDDVVNTKGETVVLAKTLMRRKHFIKTEPRCSLMAIKAAEAMALNTLYSQNPVVKNKIYTDRLYSTLQYAHQNTETLAAFEAEMAELRAEVLAFVGYDIWHIFFHKLDRNTLIIEKTVDYRIYQWHVMTSSPDRESE